MNEPLLLISDLSVSVKNKKIISSLNLSCLPGRTYILMGPNGVGKSSLAYSIVGHPNYKIDSGSIKFDGKCITDLAMHKRVRGGLFLAVQNPPVVDGVSVFNFLKEAYRAVTGKSLLLLDFHGKIVKYCKMLNIDLEFLDKDLNDGFSGGEKKRVQLLQMLVLKPKFAILDEIDSGLDVDSLKLVSESLSIMKKENPDFSVIIISHSTRLLKLIEVDKVCLMSQGKIIKKDGKELADDIENNGYNRIGKDETEK